MVIKKNIMKLTEIKQSFRKLTKKSIVLNKIINFFLNFFSFLYRKNTIIIIPLIFLFLVSLILNFSSCLEKAHFKFFIQNITYLFMILSVVLFILSIIFGSYSSNNITNLRDNSKPSRWKDFKEAFIITPYVLMMLIGFLKIYFILFNICKSHTNNYYYVKIVIFIIFFISLFLEKLYKIYFQIIKKITLFLAIFNNNKLIIITLFLRRNLKKFFVYNLITLLILLILLYKAFYFDKTIKNKLNLYIMIYVMLFYVGTTNFIHIIFSLKRKGYTIKEIITWIKFEKIIFYILITLVIILIDCFPEKIIEFIKNLIIFIKCIL